MTFTFELLTSKSNQFILVLECMYQIRKFGEIPFHRFMTYHVNPFIANPVKPLHFAILV